ncbi:NADH-ubiquinone oxidoreductase 49 kDa subunit [Hortaea werneckii]|nr:NADH-ubiquinone oxidoreductase 49 kDa subunit [Hortaea werneckii]
MYSDVASTLSNPCPLETWSKQPNHLALRRLDGRCLHVLLHGCTWWRSDFVVLYLDWASRHLVQALVNDTERLSELLHTAEVAVVAVAVDTDWDIELNLVVGVIRLRLADVPRHTRSTQHDTTEGVVERVSRANNADALGTADPNTVVRGQLASPVRHHLDGRRQRGNGHQIHVRRIPARSVNLIDPLPPVI